ncbi:cupin domain-containing protein [Granulicella arctica]|uniref:cupin domain-containing protein n=1 Tax=Granulicella arctica TaxID=940613 RepID=UPI0021E0300D|nr:cupin domain-containing protein [Granulicella arctica]
MIASVNLNTALEGLIDHWSPKVVGRVNDQYVKVAKLIGEFTWHKHVDEDELFQVIRGSMRIQIEGQPDVRLNAGDFCVVPRGTMHNPIAEQECWIMLIETVTTKHTGDVETPRTRSIEEQLA